VWLKTLERVGDFFLGCLATFPTANGGFFVRFKQLVGLKKVSDFIKHVLGQVFNVDVIREARIMLWHTQNHGVSTSFVVHPEDCDWSHIHMTTRKSRLT